MATITLAVTVSNPGSGNRYYIDGALQATVSASVDNIYKFDQSDSSNSGHPLRLSTTSNGSHNSGSEYTTGVTTSGTPGSSGAYTQISVTALTVQSLYYYCTAHSGMGGSFNVGSSSLNLKETTGISVLSLSADPVPYAQEIANNPYAGAWSSGGNLNSGRYDLRGTGIQTAALAIGGYIPGGGNNVGVVESYNGTSWSEVADITARKLAGTAGTQTAALAFGGTGATGIVAITESWNGSGWTEVADLNTARQTTTGFGLQPAALNAGGYNGSSAVAIVELWNGSSWSEVADLNTGRYYHTSFGVSTAGLVAGGSAPSTTGVVESWNGSAWTEVNDLNTARTGLGGAGTQSSGIVFASNPPSVITEQWDGTSWTEVADLATTRAILGSAGASGTSALAFGGYTGTAVSAATEEWSFSGIPPSTPIADYSDAIVGQLYYNTASSTFKVTYAGGAPAGTWASGGNLNAGRNGAGAFGTQTSAVVFGGQAPSTTATAELYNGSSWSTIPSMNNVAYRTSGIGTSGAGKQIGFFTSTEVEDWNGSGWTVGTAINTARATYNSAIGSVTAGLISGGSIASSPFPTGITPNVESWNGSSWTEVNNLNTGRNCASSGTQTAGLAISGGGYISAPSFAQVANVESWNGSTWTETTDVNLGRYGGGACGTATDSIFYTGEASTGVSANTESWNGSSWTEIANVANALVEIATTTSSPASLSIKIGGTGASALTEEWTAPEFVTKTFTVS